jgi:hypothetical protein
MKATTTKPADKFRAQAKAMGMPLEGNFDYCGFHCHYFVGGDMNGFPMYYGATTGENDARRLLVAEGNTESEVVKNLKKEVDNYFDRL